MMERIKRAIREWLDVIDPETSLTMKNGISANAEVVDWLDDRVRRPEHARIAKPAKAPTWKPVPGKLFMRTLSH